MKKRVVLLVQPHERDARVLSGYLRLLEYEVEEACSGDAALSMIEDGPAPDAILLADSLPEEDVAGVTHQIHEALPHVLLVLTETGKATATWAGKVLRRPFGLEKVREALGAE